VVTTTSSTGSAGRWLPGVEVIEAVASGGEHREVRGCVLPEVEEFLTML